MNTKFIMRRLQLKLYFHYEIIQVAEKVKQVIKQTIQYTFISVILLTLKIYLHR